MFFGGKEPIFIHLPLINKYKDFIIFYPYCYEQEESIQNIIDDIMTVFVKNFLPPPTHQPPILLKQHNFKHPLMTGLGDDGNLQQTSLVN